jgi:protein-tyrosine phosphatase
MYMRTFPLILMASMMALSCSRTPVVQDDQFLPVKGIINARDLGGYTGAGGRTVRTGKLIRAASLAEAKDADLAYFAGLPVREVIDFRQDYELKGKEDRMVPGAAYLRLPINSSAGINIEEEKEAEKIRNRKHFDVRKVIMIAAFNERAQHIAEQLYPNMVLQPDCQKQFAAFLQRVVAAEDGAVLFHCTQGKDRTGLASAYILAALGVDRETIIADFDATNRVYEKDVQRLSRRVRFFGGKEKEVAVVRSFIGANTANFTKTLDLIDATYGSMANYLTGPLGLSQEDMAVLHNKYLQ